MVLVLVVRLALTASAASRDRRALTPERYSELRLSAPAVPPAYLMEEPAER